MAPSIAVVCLVTETRKRVLTELGAMQDAETWSRGIFFMLEDWDGLFLDGTIYRGSLFSGRNTKTGPGEARNHVGG